MDFRRFDEILKNIKKIAYVILVVVVAVLAFAVYTNASKDSRTK